MKEEEEEEEEEEGKIKSKKKKRTKNNISRKKNHEIKSHPIQMTIRFNIYTRDGAREGGRNGSRGGQGIVHANWRNFRVTM